MTVSMLLWGPGMPAWLGLCGCGCGAPLQLGMPCEGRTRSREQQRTQLLSTKAACVDACTCGACLQL
jgi:hypothetical protein